MRFVLFSIPIILFLFIFAIPQNENAYSQPMQCNSPVECCSEKYSVGTEGNVNLIGDRKGYDECIKNALEYQNEINQRELERTSKMAGNNLIIVISTIIAAIVGGIIIKFVIFKRR